MRVCTWNVQHGLPPDGGAPDLARGLPALAALGADVVALQELDRHLERSARVDQPALAAAALGGELVRGPALRRGRGDYGVALVVRGAVLGHDLVALDGPGEPRALLQAEVVLAGRRWTVATVHLATRPAVARAQLAQALAHLAGAADPAVLLGDANLGGRAVAEVVGGQGWSVLPGPPTHPARSPRRRIDHVVLRGVTAARTEVVHLPVGDHRAVVADLVPATTAGSTT